MSDGFLVNVLENNNNNNNNKRSRPVRDGLSPSPEGQTPAKRHLGYLLDKEVEHIMDIGQIRDMMSSLLDEKLENINQKLDALEDIRKENAEIKVIMEELKAKNAELERRINGMECNSRATNLVFKGVAKSDDQSAVDAIKAICNNLQGFNLDINQHLVMARIIGKKSSIADAGTKKIKILAKFTSFLAVDNIMRCVKELARTGTSIERDMPIEVKRNADKLLAVKKELRAKVPDKNLRMSVQYDSLFVGRDKFNWDVAKGLMFGRKDGLQALNQLYNVDISERVRSLLRERSGAKNRDMGAPIQTN